jgi:predicted metal-dependent phosphotriesterase family hydrolase
MTFSETAHSVQGVLGPIDARQLGATQCHEHVSIDIFRVTGDELGRLVDEDLVLGDVEAAYDAGLRTIVDVGTDGHLRSPTFLRAIAQRSRVQVIAATGYWKEVVYPEYVTDLPAEGVAEALAKDVTQGILDTEIRAGVIGEIGSEATGFTELTDKVFRACALAQALTGVAVITHTPEGVDALKQLQVLITNGADPGRILIGHVDCMDDVDLHSKIAAEGAFVGYDRVGLDRYASDDVRLRLVLEMLDRGHARSLILSTDMANLRRTREHGGLGYSYLLEAFVPRLREAGVDEGTLHTILVENPARLLTGTTSLVAAGPAEVAP